jgi:hypothetical protein
MWIAMDPRVLMQWGMLRFDCVVLGLLRALKGGPVTLQTSSP